MIQVTELVKAYDDCTALNRLSLTVETGAIYGLVGVNGSGKTTLLRHMAGVLKPDSGKITIDGEAVFENEKVKAGIGYIPDELFFFPGYTLKSMASYLRGIYPDWDMERFHAITADFGLTETAKIQKFSKGMQKQAAFALTLSQKPNVLILDEPVDGLDPIMRKKVWYYVLGDVADRRMTVLVSSHNLRELEGICDWIGILSQGRLKFEGRLEDLGDGTKDMSLEELFFHEMGGER